MFFDKPIYDVTFEDVVAFCKRQIPEGKQLDYKYLLPKNKEKFAKVIASFANAMGGTIIIGVNDDKNDKPRPPFTGIPYHEKIRNTIEDIIQAYIDPIVFVDVNICVSKDGKNMFVLINIPQSNLTPHLVGKLKRPYIRTGQSSRPETIVHPSRLPWLLDHRKKSERLRHILYDKAESHFENYMKTKNVEMAPLTIATLALLPLYPEEHITPYREIPSLMKQCLQDWPQQEDFRLLPVQDGTAAIDGNSTRHHMLEFNAYGLFMSKWHAAQPLTFNGHETQAINFLDFVRNTVCFFQTANAFYSKLSFGGPLYFRLKMTNTRGLRAVCQNHTATVLEDYIRMDENYNPVQLSAQLDPLLLQLLQMTAWALGLQISDTEMREHIQHVLKEIYHVQA